MIWALWKSDRSEQTVLAESGTFSPNFEAMNRQVQPIRKTWPSQVKFLFRWLNLSKRVRA